MFKKTFARNKTPVDYEDSRIICDNVELKNRIANWTSKCGLKFENFGDILNILEISLPVKLYPFSISKNGRFRDFKCTTSLNTEVIITLKSPIHSDEEVAEIHVRNEDEKRCYHVIPGTTTLLESIVPANTFITRNNKKLSLTYTKFYNFGTLSINLKFGNSHVLDIFITEPETCYPKNEISVFRNRKEIENYLLSLDESLVVSEVYTKILELLSLSAEDVSNISRLYISHMEMVEKKENILNQLTLNYGIFEEYAITENGITYHVFKNGDWKYSSNKMCIEHFEADGPDVFRITFNIEDLYNATLTKTIDRVKETISKLQENFEKD